MTASSQPVSAPARAKDDGPPCKRCGGQAWDVQDQIKSTPRWVVETVFAAPDVWIFQGESAGWPSREYELWTCRGCGRSARVAP